jgi:hypothetical protein
MVEQSFHIGFDFSQVPDSFYPTIKYRIDNSGCHGAFVPGFGDKFIWDTLDEAIIACKILREHPEHRWRGPLYEVRMFDVSDVAEPCRDPFNSVAARLIHTFILDFSKRDADRSKKNLSGQIRPICG